MRVKTHFINATAGFSLAFPMALGGSVGNAFFGPIGGIVGLVLGVRAGLGELERIRKEGFDDSATTTVAWIFGCIVGAGSAVAACAISVQTANIQQYQQRDAEPPVQATPVAGTVPSLTRDMPIQEAARQMGLKPPSPRTTPASPSPGAYPGFMRPLRT